MKLDKKYQIERAASTDETRFAIGFVHISKDKKHLVATTGQMLARVPVTLEEGDERGTASIPPEVLMNARKKAGRLFSEATLKLTDSFEHRDGVKEPRPKSDDVGHFPNYEQIIPKNPEIKHKVTLNPRLLLELAKAIGCKDDYQGVTLEFQEGKEPTIIVRCGEGYGLLMPMRGE